MNDLKQQAIRGGLAKMFAQGGNFVLRLGSLAILARLLEPKDFGLVGMVTAVVGILGLFRDFGLSVASVQRSKVTDEQMSTLFWINILVGFILAALAMALSPAVVAFYHEPRLIGIMAVLASSFVLSAAGVQHGSILQRQMRFTALAVIDFVSLLIGSVIAVFMAMAGFRYWALCVMSVVPAGLSMLGVWITASWVPGLPRRNAGVRSMMRFGGTVTLNSVVVYLGYNLEKVLLGRYWGADSLGIYGRAYQLVSTPVDNLNSAVGGVVFSALSRLQDDPPRLRSYFLKGYSLVLALTVPTCFIFALFGNDIVQVVLGPRWMEAATILRLLAPTILVLAVINPLGWLMVALGMVGRSLRIALVLAPVVISGYVLGLSRGPKGVAFGYSAVMLLWMVPHVLWCVRGTSIHFRDLARVMARPFLSSLLGSALAAAVAYGGSHWLPLVVRLALEISTFYAGYLLVLLYGMGEKAFYIDLLRGLRIPSPSEKTTPVAV